MGKEEESTGNYTRDDGAGTADEAVDYGTDRVRMKRLRVLTVEIVE